MDWNVEITLIIRTLLASLIGAIIGLEREYKGREAGMRTYAAVALGSCTFGLISYHSIAGMIDTRIASNIVTGIGFIGAGIIFKEGNRVSGLTTAATIWATAAMALAISFGMYVLGVLTGAIIFAILLAYDLPFLKKIKERNAKRTHD